MGLNNENAYADPSWMAFDVETCPMPTCGEYLVDPIEAPSNYKDPEKIKAYIAEKRQSQILDAGLDLDLCEVVAIAGEFHDSGWCQTRERSSEEEMLRGFWRFAAYVLGRNGSLIGFNCLHFDLPILLRRSLYLGIPTPRVSVDKYRHDGVVDLADVLTYGGKTKWRSLGFYAKRFGIAHDDSVQGEDIAALVAAGEWSKVEAHCVADVATTAALARRIGIVAGAVQPTLEPAGALL